MPSLPVKASWGWAGPVAEGRPFGVRAWEGGSEPLTTREPSGCVSYLRPTSAPTPGRLQVGAGSPLGPMGAGRLVSLRGQGWGLSLWGACSGKGVQTPPPHHARHRASPLVELPPLSQMRLGK